MITATNLKKKYSDFTLDVSLEIPTGMVTGLIGKNGAGKSTVIKAILGLIHLDGGTIRVFGKDTLLPEDRQDIGVALADSGFSGYLTVRNTADILEGCFRNFDRDVFFNRCRQYGIPENKLIKEFSTGMKAKLRVLAAMCHNAKLLILDEPTAGMDVLARGEILDMIREYLSEQEDRSILITSHIATDLEGLCDDLYLIDDGKILLHEELDHILSDFGLLKVSESDWEHLDRDHILKTRREPFGYSCLTDQRGYYAENYPRLVVEKCGIDTLILMMTGGK